MNNISLKTHLPLPIPSHNIVLLLHILPFHPFRGDRHHCLRTELTLYEAARDYLKEHAPKETTTDGKVKFRTPSIKSLRAEKEKLTVLKNQQYEEFSFVRAKYRELQAVANNVNQMLNLEHPIQMDIQHEQQSEPQKPQQKNKSSQQQKETGQSL